MTGQQTARKFLVDAMLGKLATWLRLAGCDTVYNPGIHDDELLKMAVEETRILLSSDVELVRRAENQGVSSMLVRGSVDFEVAEVFRVFQVAPQIDPSKARCSKCNGQLTELRNKEREKIKDLVFEQTYDHYDIFWHCQECDNVYFQGGYWDNIQKYMERIQKIMEIREQPR